MKTDDVEARPLPSVALLELQWFLQRVMGMAGAADLGDMEEEPGDSDDAISDLGLSEVGDVSYLSDAGPSLHPSDPVVPDPNSTYPLPLPTIEGTKHQTDEMGGDELVM
jgi:hypothetical protein